MTGHESQECRFTGFSRKTFQFLKDIKLSCSHKIDKAILSSKLVDDLIEGFDLTSPLYHYLLDTIVEAKQPR